MWSIGLYVATLVTICFIYLVLKRRNLRGKKMILPPGSKGFPLIGETLQFLTPSYTLDLHSFIRSRIQRYGPIFRTHLIGWPMVVSTDLDFNRYIIRQEGRQEGSPVELWYMETYSKLFNLEGEGKNNVLGLAHKYVRNTTMAHFGSEPLKDNLLPLLQDLIEKYLHNSSTHDSIEVKELTFMMMTEITAKKLLGYDADQISKENLGEKLSQISKGLFCIPLDIPGSTYHTCIKKQREVMDVLRRVVKERVASPKTGRGDFLDNVIEDLNSNSQKFLSEDFIQLIMFSLLVTGDSSSITLPLILSFLSQNPHVLEELEAEHERIVKSRENPNSPLTWNEVKSMSFTLNVINESLRLASPSLGLMRKTVKEIQINGYTIPAGWGILLITNASHYDPNIYKDPFTFNPWRWEKMQPDVISKTFMPFGGGIRQCTGAEFTKVFMSTFLHVLVTKYRWKKIKGGEICRNPVVGMKNGFHIKLTQKIS